MATFGLWLLVLAFFSAVLLDRVSGTDIYLEWNLSSNWTLQPVTYHQPVIMINGKFPGPLINVTTNDIVHVNVFNSLDESVLITWNGLAQEFNSWQDGVSGTNCPVQPGQNWTYVFQVKGHGTFTYFPSTNYQKLAGGFGAIRVNNLNVFPFPAPFSAPEAEFDVLIGDWSFMQYKTYRSMLHFVKDGPHPDVVLMNGKGPYGYFLSKSYESFNVAKGNTYLFRISNVGTTFSLNFRIQNHKMLIVETEGSYTEQITVDSLDVHVGQSYSVIVTADQAEADYYMVASPKFLRVNDSSPFMGKGILHYANSTVLVGGPLPTGPNPFDIDFSVNQAKSIRKNSTIRGVWPIPHGNLNLSNVDVNKTFILHGSVSDIVGLPYYVVNNISYLTLETPLKLADYRVNGSGVYNLDQFPTQSVNEAAAFGISVVTGIFNGWHEFVFQNDLKTMDAWHLDGNKFYVVGYGNGKWTREKRSTYNLDDPVLRSTVQVYPRGWTAVYAFFNNPGMWNLRSQHLKHWYLGQELYIRVHDDEPNNEAPPPQNLLLCGIFKNSGVPAASPARSEGW